MPCSSSDSTIVALRRWRSPMTGGAATAFMRRSGFCHGSTRMNTDTAKDVPCPAHRCHAGMLYPRSSVESVAKNPGRPDRGHARIAHGAAGGTASIASKSMPAIFSPNCASSSRMHVGLVTLNSVRESPDRKDDVYGNGMDVQLDPGGR